MESTISGNEVKTILIYGDSKTGKTMAYCSLIGEKIKENPETQFYIISTDKGLRPTLNYYFNNSPPESNIHIYDSPDARTVLNSTEEIQKKAKPIDWIIIDLISDLWEFAQDEYINQTKQGDKVIDYIIDASKDPKKFGLFESVKWQYIKRIDHAVSRNLITSSICNIFGICSEKDVGVEEKISGGITEFSNMYKKVGKRPSGQKQLQHKFNTIIYLKYVPATDKRYCIIVGNRGKDNLYKKIDFEKNWYEKVKNEF